MKRHLALWIVGVAASCSAVVHEEDTAITGDRSATSIAIVNVNVVPMDQDRVIQSQTVLIDNGRITSIGPASSTQVPAGSLRIDARGKYLLPGLIDMHVHIRTSELDKYLPAGVTSVRNMWGYNELPAIMRDIETGVRKGPHIFSLTAGFDGSPAQWPQTQLSDDPSLISAMVDRQYDLGFREIKVYQRLSRAAYDTIVAVAKRKGMTFAGHTPTLVGLDHVLESGQRSIEHLGGYSTGSQLDAQISATIQAGTYNCPTIAVQSLLTPSRGDGLRAITLALHTRGARLLVGTDAGIDVTAAGSSIHDELELFVRAGIPAFDALLGATRTAAEYLGQSSAIGTIAVGKEADLILVRGNPLQDIRSTREIEAVIVNGTLLN
ncbi:MAG: amidohydrolase family protein [Gemmatimonadales bacterium]